MRSPFILFNQCSYPVISHEDTNEASSSSSFILFSSPVDPIQAFSVDHIPFLVSNAFSCRCTSHSLTSCYSFVPECWRYLRRFVFPFLIRSSYLEIVISFKPFNSTGAISFSSNHFNGVSFEWALTHRSFPRILPDSSNFPGVSKILFKVWRKDGLSSVICLSPRSFKFFSLLIQPFYSSWFRSASTIHGGVSHHHSQILKTEEEFFLHILLHSLQDSWL